MTKFPFDKNQLLDQIAHYYFEFVEPFGVVQSDTANEFFSWFVPQLLLMNRLDILQDWVKRMKENNLNAQNNVYLSHYFSSGNVFYAQSPEALSFFLEQNLSIDLFTTKNQTNQCAYEYFEKKEIYKDVLLQEKNKKGLDKWLEIVEIIRSNLEAEKKFELDKQKKLKPILESLKEFPEEGSANKILLLLQDLFKLYVKCEKDGKNPHLVEAIKNIFEKLKLDLPASPSFLERLFWSPDQNLYLNSQLVDQLIFEKLPSKEDIGRNTNEPKTRGISNFSISSFN